MDFITRLIEACHPVGLWLLLSAVYLLFKHFTRFYRGDAAHQYSDNTSMAISWVAGSIGTIAFLSVATGIKGWFNLFVRVTVPALIGIYAGFRANIIDPKCPTCEREIPPGTIVCPHCLYVIHLSSYMHESQKGEHAGFRYCSCHHLTQRDIPACWKCGSTSTYSEMAKK